MGLSTTSDDGFDLHELWNGCKEELKKEIGQPNFSSYLEPTRAVRYDENEITVVVPSSFVANWLQKNYLETILCLLDQKTAKSNRIKLIVESQKPKRVSVPVPVMQKKIASPDILKQFKSQYSFDTFVVGKCNEFAHASSLQCAKNPGEQYNPLFIYGGVGLGKTHLMQGIGRYIAEKSPEKNILYLSSEQFVNQMISSLQKGQMERFRKKFRTVDVLLVDDIQFIAGKDRTQEEFFHTYNTLFEEGKQIVVSSDLFPKDIKKLEERLKSRFEWGLIADIQTPDLETKIAIINKKAALNGYQIPPEVGEYLAETIKSNIRELEGCLARVVAYSSLSGRVLNLDLAKETMDGVYSEAKKHIDSQQIQGIVAEYFSLKISELKSKNRTKRLVIPRQMAMFLCREFTDDSLPEIGKKFGGRDHSTVIHAYKKIVREVEINTRLYNDLTAIKKSLGL
jgi:chromosomal replication initiator protein